MQPRTPLEHAWDQDYAVALDIAHEQNSARIALLPLYLTILAARDGDSNAFSSLVQQYYAAASRVARQILLSESAAADAVQEALIKAHRAMYRFQDGNFRSWFLRIVANACYDELRLQKRRRTVSLDELTEESNGEQPPAIDSSRLSPMTEDPEEMAIHNEGMQSLFVMIGELPIWQRNVVLLIDVHGHDYGETASLLQVPVGTVKSRLHRARGALRDRLVSGGSVTFTRQLV
jgi:RNA polymerase sigma-70 factor, ECF subfamily